jgi:predicted RNA-binding protein with PUA-like domain
MNHFLLKTEPSVYSYDDLVKEKKAVWDGVANNTALKNLRSMNKGDHVFIYHSGDEKQIVGIAKVVSDPYPDPTLNNPAMVVVDIQAVTLLGHPVPLSVIKSNKQFSSFPLVTIGRLSVMPVSDREWETILSLSK